MLAGDGHSLFDPARQAAEQLHLFGTAPGDVLQFAYPPHVAGVYAVFALLPYRAAYHLHSAAMVGAIIGGYFVVRPTLPATRPPGLTLAALGFAFGPLLLGTAQGQNVGLTLLLFAVLWSRLATTHHAGAGVAAGLLLFKRSSAQWLDWH